jgi:hypothetical protein
VLRLAAATVVALTAAAHADVAEPTPEPPPDAPPPPTSPDATATVDEPAATPVPVETKPAKPHKEAAPPPLPLDWTDAYHGEIVAVDAVAVGLVLAALASDNSNTASRAHSYLELALATYLIGPPMVHLLHDRGTTALASLGLRVGLPVVGAFIGAAIDQSGDSGATVLFGLGGLISAWVIDAALLAKGDPLPATVQVTAAPVRDGRGVTLGLAGSF